MLAGSLFIFYPSSMLLAPSIHYHSEICSFCMGCHLAPDETVVTLIKTGSSGTFLLFAVYSTIMLPLRGNCSGDLFLRTAYLFLLPANPKSRNSPSSLILNSRFTGILCQKSEVKCMMSNVCAGIHYFLLFPFDV